MTFIKQNYFNCFQTEETHEEETTEKDLDEEDEGLFGTVTASVCADTHTHACNCVIKSCYGLY